MIRKTDQIVDEDLRQLSRVEINTRDGLKYKIENGLLFLPKKKEPIYSGFEIIRCRRGRKLEIKILAGGQAILLHESAAGVKKIKIET